MPVSEDGTPRPVYLALKSADVCHSYWVPRLAGKVDLIPGRTNWITLQTNEPGLFLGQCAEYCGDQHAKMLIRVNVDSPADFDRWLEHQAQPAVDDPAARDGKQAFLAQSCINCHRVRDTPARGTYAPDLTHLMSRETLASGIMPNTPENLAAWVRDPQSDQTRLPDARLWLEHSRPRFDRPLSAHAPLEALRTTITQQNPSNTYVPRRTSSWHRSRPLFRAARPPTWAGRPCFTSGSPPSITKRSASCTC